MTKLLIVVFITALSNACHSNVYPITSKFFNQSCSTARNYLLNLGFIYRQLPYPSNSMHFYRKTGNQKHELSYFCTDNRPKGLNFSIHPNNSSDLTSIYDVIRNEFLDRFGKPKLESNKKLKSRWVLPHELTLAVMRINDQPYVAIYHERRDK